MMCLGEIFDCEHVLSYVPCVKTITTRRPPICFPVPQKHMQCVFKYIGFSFDFQVKSKKYQGGGGWGSYRGVCWCVGCAEGGG